jgi:hypothetical protein
MVVVPQQHGISLTAQRQLCNMVEKFRNTVMAL